MKKIILLFVLFSTSAFGQGSKVGKFQLMQLGNLARHQYLLNTETGEVWNVVSDTDGRSIFQTVPFSCYNSKLEKMGTKDSLNSEYCYVKPDAGPIDGSKLP